MVKRMKINEVVEKIKNYTRGINILDGEPKRISEITTRDKILFGDGDKECTGIVTTCYASVEVIEKAHEKGANLIICHEALFWNHGDHTDWLEESHNKTYIRKRDLLKEYDMTVWRCHDYIHSGLPDGRGGWYDGIFKGFLHESGLEEYYVPSVHAPIQYTIPVVLDFKGMKVKDIAKKIIDGTGINGMRLIGDPETEIHYAMIPMHILFNDNEKITMIDHRNIDLLIAMEMIDYTVNIYMRDSISFKDSKAVLTAGHFNTEEPGMKYMLKWLPEALETENIPLYYVQSGDANQYILKEGL